MKPVQRKSGCELFSNGVDLLKFWQWAHSDILGNAERGKLAEYIVAMALGCAGSSRVEWDAYDLMTPNGTKVEVKSSAYLQTWKQRAPSRITFDISPTCYWNEETNLYSEKTKRQSDVYVFCVFKCLEAERADPLNLSQWDFYILPTVELDRALLSQKSITLGSLKRLPVIATDFEGIPEVVERALGQR